MSADYKSRATHKQKKSLPGYMWLLSGLAIGLFVAFIVYLDKQPENDKDFGTAVQQELEKLREVMEGCLDARMSEDAELFHAQQKLRSIVADHDQGRTTALTQPWLHVHRGTGLSLAEHAAAAVAGGSMTRRIERWREAFTRKKAKNILRHPGGLAEPAAPQRATQRDAGAPRPPSCRDAVHSPHDMREIIIKRHQKYCKGFETLAEKLKLTGC